MRAIGFSRTGPPEVLHVVGLPLPEPGPGEVRVRVEAAAVHPADIAIRAGAYPATGTPPHVPGMAVAGVVDATGDRSGWDIGDAVMTMTLPSGPHGGGYAEAVIAPGESLARIPRGLDAVAAAALPMNGHTALQSLRLLALSPGDTVAVTGAAGALGGIVIPLAVADGLRVVADAAPGDARLVAARGAHVVVDRGDDVAHRIRAAVPAGVDAVIDAAVLDEAIVPAIRDGGAIAALRGWRGEPGRGIRVHRVAVTDEYRDGPGLDRISRLVESGALTPRGALRFHPAEAAAAHRLVAGGGLRQDVVITFAPA